MAADDDGYVYSAYITLKNGKRLYARQVGLQAFRFRPSGGKKPPKQQDLFDNR